MEPPKQRLWSNREPILGGIALALLLGGCFWVLRPFMSALMWAIILAYSLSPLQRTFTRWFRGARTLAACLVTLTVTIMFAGPVVFIGLSLAQDGKDLANATRDWFMEAPDAAPPWVKAVPIVGDELGQYWQDFAVGKKKWMDQIDKQVKSTRTTNAEISMDPDVSDNSEQVEADNATAGASDAKSSHLIVMLGKGLASARSWLLSAAKALVQGVSQVVISAFLAFFLLRDGPELARRLGVAVERLAGDRGQRLIKVAGDTVRGVIFGILGTALAQALVAGLGFWIAGVPGAVLLSVLTFFFAVIPFGPPLIWLPAALWLFAQDRTGYGIFMLFWGLAMISSVDNILRPYLISHGSKTPFALVFCGVIGGALAFGLVGVFLGPILLAVAFRLIVEWTSGRDGSDTMDDGALLLPDEENLNTEPLHDA